MFSEGSLFYMVMQGTFLSHLILLILIIMSVASIAIIAWKVVLLRQIHSDSRSYKKKFKFESFIESEEIKNQKGSILEAEVVALKKELIYLQSKNLAPNHLLERLEKFLEIDIEQNSNIVEKGVSILASISGSAPFIGLLGTVLGVINAFHGIGQKGVASLAVVAPGISEALVATAFGLFAAIPALLGYNFLRNEIRKLKNELLIFGVNLINKI